MANANTSTSFLWGGSHQYQTDYESGLMLLGNRYHDCSVGRFISQDPAQDESNWYSYCGNNPLVAVDPSGLTPEGATPRGPPVSLERGVCDGRTGWWKTYKNGAKDFEPDPAPPVVKKGHGDGGRNQGAKGEQEHSLNEKGNPLPPNRRNQGQRRMTAVEAPQPSLMSRFAQGVAQLANQALDATKAAGQWAVDHPLETGLGAVIVVGVIVAPEIVIPIAGASETEFAR